MSFLFLFAKATLAAGTIITLFSSNSFAIFYFKISSVLNYQKLQKEILLTIPS